MTALIILFLFCPLLVAVGCLLRRVDWQSIEKENERYYTPDGYHVYYDRKILRRLREEEQKKHSRKKENSKSTELSNPDS